MFFHIIENVNKHKIEVNERNGMGLERQRPRMDRLERSMARKRPIQPSAPMAEAGLDAREGSGIWRMAPRISDQPMGLRQVPMAAEVVVGPSRVRPPPLRWSLCPIPLAELPSSTNTLHGILVR